MGWKDRTVFRLVVPRAVRRAARVLTVSERTKARPRRALRRRRPSGSSSRRTASTPPSRQVPARARLRPLRRGDPAAQEPARGARGRDAVGLPLVVVGPEKDAALAAELRERGARLEGYVDDRRASPSSTAAPRASCSRAATRASASPWSRRWRRVRRSSPFPIRRCARSPATRPCSSTEAELADGIRTALAERERLVAAGLERARAFSWRATAERTLAVYREILGT